MATHPAECADDPPGGIVIQRTPIDTATLLAAVADVAAGGNVLFVGTARGVTDGVITKSLAYEAHEPLARKTLEALRLQALARFSLTACGIVHRLGPVAAGEASVAIAASAPHRREAFAAAEWLMERIKADVPIWKSEERDDGGRVWVHPVATARPGGAA
ncbi:MAG: molybdenum cofactor biosynthesis protein MoaE [Planctomycetia bacterium]|nr:molybdenum cofactor biosynthesis protein MoaE [Planctomycetia bacterium]